MMEQEKVHLAKFEELIPLNRVRPTVLMPLWRIGAYGLGVATALMGEKAAMACTVAVESVVGDHYNDQIRELLAEDPVAHAELLEVILHHLCSQNLFIARMIDNLLYLLFPR